MSKQIIIACKTESMIDWRELKTLQGDLKSLSRENYEKLKTEVTNTGFAFPLFVWQDGSNTFVLGGNQRLRCVRQMVEREGYECDALPVVYIQAKNKKEAKRRVIQDVSQYGHVEKDGLYEFMHDAEIDIQELLKTQDIPNLDMEAFNLEYFSSTEEQDASEDEVPDVDESVAAKVKLGDLYILGEHRLLCGDSTDILQVERLMNGERADMVFTDPPYGMSIVNVESGPINQIGGYGIEGKAKRGVYRPVIGDDSVKTAVDAYNLCAGLDIKTLVFWGANFYANALPNSSGWLCWDKDNGEGFFADGELAWTNRDKQLRILKHQWKGMIKGSEMGQKRVHPTQKPIALAEWAFDICDKDSKSILDLFGGSGSTLIACEKTKRKCFMSEIDPVYCDVIIRRWMKYSGKMAYKISDANGELKNGPVSFAEISSTP